MRLGIIEVSGGKDTDQDVLVACFGFRTSYNKTPTPWNEWAKTSAWTAFKQLALVITSLKR